MKAFALALLAVAASANAPAQTTCPVVPSSSSSPVCEVTESPRSCANRINNLGAQPDPEAAAPEEAANGNIPGLLDLVNTGDGSNSSITDYLPLIRLLLDNGSLGQDDEKIGFELSKSFGPEEKKLQTKLSVKLERPDVFEPIRKAMQADSLNDELSALEKDIDVRDELGIGLSISFASDKYGRHPESHRPRLEAMTALADENDETEILARRRQREFAENNGIDSTNLTSAFCELIPIKDSDSAADRKKKEELRKQYMQITLDEIMANRTAVRGFAKRLENLGFYDVLDLINNQPQLNFTVTFRDRSEAAGPGELKANFAWEFGLKDVNGLAKFEERRCNSEASADCLANYLGTSNEGGTGPIRFKLDADYTKIERLEFALPTPGFSYLAEATERLSVNATLGLDIGARLAGGKRARLDGTLTFENFSDDPLRQDRGIVTATLTYPLMQGFYLSLGAVYATKPEFRGEVDKEIGARAGITYKIVEDK